MVITGKQQQLCTEFIRKFYGQLDSLLTLWKTRWQSENAQVEFEMGLSRINGSRYSRMGKVNFVEDSL